MPVQIVPTENLPGFGELGLPASLVGALVRAGINEPFPIQAATIPDIIAGRDLLGRASTGSGKTLAFGLPLIMRVDGSPTRPKKPRGLVLVPTRELAMQVTDALAPLAQSRNVTVRLVAGGLPIGKQMTALERGVDILVATPGRLVDLIQRGAVTLSDVEVTVLDEADHMADLGFLPVVRDLLNMTAPGGQRLLFSATLDGDVAVVVAEYLTDPAVHALASAAASVDTMSHHLFRVEHESKFTVISEIAAREGRTILFVRTKHGAERMAKQLRAAGVAADAIHGDRSQSQRNRALSAFKDGHVSVLVATDVAARGIHVDDVSLVLHVDPPNDHKDYLHRSGRTARAGQSGLVVMLATRAEERGARKLLIAAGVSPQQRDVAPGDVTVSTLTGSRAPSGVPVAEHVIAAKPAANGRPNSGGSGARGRQSYNGRRGPRPASSHGAKRTSGPRRTAS